MTRFGAASLRRSPACRLAARLALLFFALRAVLPVGYMPDLDALGHGEVRIVVCTGSGTETLLVDETGRPLEGGAGDAAPHRAAGDCTFGTVTAQAIALPAAAVAFLPPVRHTGFPDADGHQAAAPRAPGPPVGPRAPPVLLG